MPLYFLVHDARRFQEEIRPALAASWRQRSFEPCRPLGIILAPEVRSFQERFYLGHDEPLLSKIDAGVAFDRESWRLLVGEMLLYGAAEIPEIPTAPDTFTCLLAPDQFEKPNLNREQFAPIQQVHFGTRDLVFGGGFYRPEHAGYNDPADVARLTDYLDAIDSATWTEADLAAATDLTSDEERAEELELARAWLPLLRELYRQARETNRIIVNEIL